MKRSQRFPLSLIQKQFWLLNQACPDSSAYNIPSIFRIKGALNKDALEKSINSIIKRHDIFRSCFRLDDDDVYQHVYPSFFLNIQVESYPVSPGILSDDTIDHLIKKEIRSPFDLTRPPLLRVKLIQIKECESLLLITMHHIITDLRTKDLFAEELAFFYEAYTTNTDATLPDSIQQYVDYSIWLREWLAGRDCQSMLAFWENQLEGQRGILELPMEGRRPSVLPQKGNSVRIDLDHDMTRDMKTVSRRFNVNIYLFMLTAYVVLLSRYSGQKDITIGVPLTNRRRLDDKNTMGVFVNIIPLRIILPDQINFSELLRLVRVAMLNAHRNQDTPYLSIINQIRHVKDTSYNPLFQTGFTFDHPMKLTLSGLCVDSLYVHNGGAQLDLFATLWESESGVCGVIEYNEALFSAAIANRLAESYKLILKSVIDQGDALVSKIEVMSERDIEKVLVTWNATKTSPSPLCCVHALFEKQVETRPDSVAAIFDDHTMTYGEMNKHANQLAGFLSAQGVGPGDFIGIYMNRSLNILVALLGILKAGAAYVPIDPEFPEERIRYMITHSKVAALVSEDGLKDSLSGMNVKVMTSSDWNGFACQNAVNPDIAVTADHLAYIIYTSGSTGQPKGVQVHHGAVVNFLNSMALCPGLTDQDVLLAVTTLSFDIAVLELFLPLVTGGITVIASKELASDGSGLLDAISHYGITCIQATPVTFRLLVLAGWNQMKNIKVLCGGEAMPLDLAEKLVERSSEVWNMYGPTETTVWSTCCRVVEPKGSLPIGRPIANTTVYVLDEWMKPVPIGTKGTLFIGGAGVSKGYLYQPELTKDKFVRNPFSTQTSDYIYNTGDIAKFRNDGQIELMGRSDFQIKLNGFRIEAGEIETALESHDDIEQSKVIVHRYDAHDARLIAYYTSVNGASLNPGAIRDYIVGKLPAYMIPSLFIMVDRMPLTPNGKVDGRQLPQPEMKHILSDQAYAPPTNDIERTLCDLWCAVLRTEKVGVDDTFFEIGGTSLLSVQVLNRINQVLNQSLRLVTFYQYPTIRSLANYLRAGEGTHIDQDKKNNRARLRKEALIRSKQRKALN